MRPGGDGTQDEDFGRLERSGALSVLRYERRLAHAQQKVWSAVTEDAHLAAWFPTTIEGARLAGAPLHFAFRESEGEPFDGEMLAFVPPSLMELRWADDVLRFELEPGRAGVHPAPDGDVPRTRQGGARRRRLARVPGPARRRLRRCGPRWRPPDRWRVVHAVYVERLGPEASAIGPPEEWERAHGSGDRR